MEQEFYPSTDIETQPATDDLILWDIGNNQKVTSIRTNVLNSSPFWSKENTFFITEADEEYLTHQNVNYLGGEEIIRVSVDGQIERLSYMTTTKEVYTYDYMLSPDEEKLSLKIA